MFTTEVNSQQEENCFSFFETEVTDHPRDQKLIFNNRTDRFRTVITNSYKSDSVNFAGFNIITSWGCGTACQSHAIIDTESGEVNFLPFSTASGILIRANSNLLISDPYREEDKKSMPFINGDTMFFEFKDDSLFTISRDELPKSCQEYY